MKIRITKTFRYQVDARNDAELKPGIHDVPEEIANLAIMMRAAEKIVEKKAPENKVVEVAENKKKVARKSGRRRSTRTKPD